MTMTDAKAVVTLTRLADAFKAFGDGRANAEDVAALDHAIAALSKREAPGPDFAAKGCPFCGSESWELDRTDGGSVHWLFCRECKSCGPHCATEVEALSGWKARAMIPDWEDISTAPKDSYSRLVWVPDSQCIFTVTWRNPICKQDAKDRPSGWYIFGPGSGAVRLNQGPTHWMPLPEPPK